MTRTYISSVGAGGVSSRKHAVAHVVVHLLSAEKENVNVLELQAIQQNKNICCTSTINKKNAKSNLLAGAHEGLIHTVRILGTGLHVGKTVLVCKCLRLGTIYLAPGKTINIATRVLR